MALTKADVEAKLTEVQTALDAEQEQIKSTIDGQAAVIEELKAKIEELEGGGVVTAEDLQAWVDKLDTMNTDLKGTIPDTPIEPPPPTE